MNRASILLLVLLVVAILGTVASAADRVMGNWAGKWRNDNGEEEKLEAQVIALGGDSYEAKFLAHYDEKQATFPVKLEGKRDGEKVGFAGKVDLGKDAGGVFEWTGQVAEGKFTGRYHATKDVGRFEMDRVEKKSATLGEKPPKGAVVLFDGKDLNAWKQRKSDKPGEWKVADGVMEVAKGTGDILTSRTFGDHKLHLEFRTPFMPEARGQGRGNSGVYLQGRYEVQVLDSFGLEGLNNECGGIYTQHAPKVNACLPPEEWQTYDITFHAAKVDAAGKVVKQARMTILHNGVTIHDDVELKGLTGGAIDDKEGTPGPLLLQDHGNPVQFRNIWVVESGGK